MPVGDRVGKFDQMKALPRHQIEALVLLFAYFEGDLDTTRVLSTTDLWPLADKLGFDQDGLRRAFVELADDGLLWAKTTIYGGQRMPTAVRARSPARQPAQAAAIRLGIWDHVMLPKKDQWMEEDFRNFLASALYRATQAKGVRAPYQARVDPAELAAKHELEIDQLWKAGTFLRSRNMAKLTSDSIWATQGVEA